jgi:hypothetical protein
MKTPDQLEAWEMTEYQKLTLVGILAHHLARIDPSGSGVRLVDFISSLYPATIGDGQDNVRAAVAKLTRTVSGRKPEAVRLGRIFGANKNKPLPGSLCLRSIAFDMAHNCALWTALGTPGATPPVLSGSETAAPAPKVRRHVADDTPACRERVENFIGGWLIEHREELPGAPAEFSVISTAAVNGDDLALYNERFALVTYTKDMVGDSRLRMPEAHWKGLAAAHARGATIYICMCNDEPGYMAFNTYQDYLDQNRSIEGGVVHWPAELATWFGNFKQVAPQLLSFRTAGAQSDQLANVPKISRFLAMLLQQEPELADAVMRGWLLSTMRPEDGLVGYWGQRCEIESAIDLHVCVYRAARRGIPGVPTCTVRLDLCPAALTFSEPQLQAVLDGLAVILARTDPELAAAMGAQRITMSPPGVQGVLVATPKLISFVCAGVVAIPVGELLYEHASRLRPKRLVLGR